MPLPGKHKFVIAFQTLPTIDNTNVYYRLQEIAVKKIFGGVKTPMFVALQVNLLF